MNLSKSQKRMLVKIARSPYTCMDGGMPFEASDTLTWADTVIENVEDETVFDYMMILGLVIQEGIGKDSRIRLTEDGFKEFQEIFNPSY